MGGGTDCALTRAASRLACALTAVQNVMLPLAASGMANAEQRVLADAALAQVGLADKGARLPQDLTGGEQQRVAIARAIVNRPPIVLADEPTGCLDSRSGQAIMELFLGLRASGLTIFMVTHDRTIASYADRIVALRDGRWLDGDGDRHVAPSLVSVGA